MRELKKKQTGITLIALVISIIVMLILAGVSINAMIGDNGILTQAQAAKVAQRIAFLKEELELNIVGAMSGDGIEKREQVTVLNSSIRKYLPSIEDNEIGVYGVVAGELYYIGEDSVYKEMATSQGVKVMEEGLSTEEFMEEVESKAIENIVKSFGGAAFVQTDEEGNSVYAGVQLFDKNIANANRWKIISEVEDEALKSVYGTGWYFVEAGTNVQGVGSLKKDYIINYNLQKAVQFDARKHSMLSVDSTLKVKDHLVFNADPGVIENKDSSSFGEGTQLIGYSSDLSDAFTNTSFIFDGVDDCINIPYDTSTDISSGFTYEFYGKILGPAKHYCYKSATDTFEEIPAGEGFIGLFGLWNGNTSGQAKLRFGVYPNGNNIKLLQYNWGFDEGVVYYDTFYHGSDYWNHRPDISSYNINYNTEFSWAVSIDIANAKQYIFLNGNKILEGDIVLAGWNKFISSVLPTLNTFTLGRCSMNENGQWHYSHAEAYSLRLYNRPLTEAEELANYNATVAYHEFLNQGGDASSFNVDEAGELSGADAD